MRILFFIHGLPVGGAETATLDNIVALKNKGADVSLVLYDDRPGFLRDRLVKTGIPFYSVLPFCSFSPIGKAKRFIFDKLVNVKRRWKKIIGKVRPDIVHYNDYSPLIKDLPFEPSRSVMTFHSDVIRAVKNETEKTKELFLSLAEKGMTFVSLSDKMSKDISKIFGTANVVKTGNPVDVQSIRDQVTDRDKFLSELNIPKDSFIVGHVGRFHPVKNHERLIDIFGCVRRSKDNAYLVLVGCDCDGRTEKIRKRACDLGLCDHVRFLGERSDAVGIIGCFDALLLPSESESFSLVLIEAQIKGVRCVASDRVPEDVAINGNCFRLPLESSDEDWAKTVLGKERTGERGDLSVFDVSAVADRLLGVYDRISGEKQCRD